MYEQSGHIENVNWSRRITLFSSIEGDVRTPATHERCSHPSCGRLSFYCASDTTGRVITINDDGQSSFNTSETTHVRYV